MLPRREVATALPRSGTAIDEFSEAARVPGDRRVVPNSIEAVSDVTAARDRQRGTS
jgi:hypothetical protein